MDSVFRKVDRWDNVSPWALDPKSVNDIVNNESPLAMPCRDALKQRRSSGQHRSSGAECALIRLDIAADTGGLDIGCACRGDRVKGSSHRMTVEENGRYGNQTLVHQSDDLFTTRLYEQKVSCAKGQR